MPEINHVLQQNQLNFVRWFFDGGQLRPTVKHVWKLLFISRNPALWLVGDLCANLL